jgi:SAM-dependent methyltransferase
MEGYQQGTYGQRYAPLYDAWHADFMDTDAAVIKLAELAGAGGTALDLGSGTGRLAVALAARGITVHAIEIAPEMVAQMQAKPGGDAVRVTVGDMTETELTERFDLVYIGHNTIMALPDQAAQVACFRNAARHLRPGGRFALETMFNQARGGDRRDNVRCMAIEPDEVMLIATIADPVTGGFTGTQIVLRPGGTTFYPVRGRAVSHFEMDLMAQLAGLELQARWGDWHEAPFTATSTYHVSVYRSEPHPDHEPAGHRLRGAQT